MPATATGSKPARWRGTCKKSCSNISKKSGTARIAECGKSAANRASSHSRRSCAGWRSTARSSRANSLRLIGRRNDAIKLFEKLLAVRNDLGLMSEEYDPRSGRLLGNFPQAFSHIEIINTAAHLSEIESASAVRGDPEEAEHDGK